MTLSTSDILRPALIAGLITGLAVILCTSPNTVFAQSSDQSTPPAEEKLENPPTTSPPESKSGTVDPQRRFYLGPGGANSPQKTGPESRNAADHAPTSILIGPYLPPDSIALPGTGPLLSTEDQLTPDEITDDSTSGSGPFGQSEQELADAIAIDRLERLDPADIGIWTDNTIAAFPVTMWDGSRRAVLEALLPVLSAHPASPTIKSLLRRLLLSPAIVPPMQSRDQENGTSGIMDRPDDERTTQASHPLLLARLDRLYAAGLVDDFLMLADQLQPEVTDEGIARLHANALLAIGEHDQACALARSAIGQSGAAFWLQIVAMCEALDGKRAATHLQLALLDDAGESNALFNTLVEHLLAENEGRGTELPQAPALSAAGPLSPTLYALFRLSGIPIPDDLALTAPAVLLHSLAGNPDLSAGTRLVLAEKGAKSGLVTGENLAAIYSSLSFTEADRQAIFASLEEANNPDPAAFDEDLDDASQSFTSRLVTGPRLNALLWQQVAQAGSNAERMRWIEIAFEHSRKNDMAFAMAGALAEPLTSVDASMSLGGYADSAGAIHLINGNHSAAIAWYEAARLASESGNDDAKRAHSALWPLLVISDNTGAVTYNAARLTQWWNHNDVMDPSMRLIRGDRFFTRLGDLGMDVPQDLLNAVLAAPSVTTTTPPANLWRQLLDAIRHDRLGETVLASLAAIDDDGLAHTSPALLSATITGLRLLHLEADARSLAFDTMIIDGF